MWGTQVSQLLSLVPGGCLGVASSFSSVTAKANTASPELWLLPGPYMEITQLENAGLQFVIRVTQQHFHKLVREISPRQPKRGGFQPEQVGVGLL